MRFVSEVKIQMEMEEEIPIFAINAYLYCPYRYYIEYVKGQFSTNEHVEEGRYIDEKKSKKAQTKGYKRRQGIFVHSNSLGIYGFVDEVIKTDEKTVIVETKKGNATKPFKNDVLQLVAYLICYCETFDEDIKKVVGRLHYVGSEKKFEVKADTELVSRLREILREMRRIADEVPQPRYNKKHCSPCSLLDICMPSAKKNGQNLVRKVTPHSYKPPIFLSSQGAFVGRAGESIVISHSGEELLKAHFSEIGTLYLMGNVQISSQALKLLVQNAIPIVFTDLNGALSAMCTGAVPKNVFLRLKQLETYKDQEKRLCLAKKIVLGKVRNQVFVLTKKSLLRGEEKAKFKELERAINDCWNFDELLGIEGVSANTYFEIYKRAFEPIWNFNERNRRPPKDPINALLSFGYTLLHNTVLSVLVGIGFEPLLGVLHTDHYGRFALALDLMEEFRPIIVDQLVLSLVNLRHIKPSDFIENIQGSFVLTDRGRKKFLEHYKDRLETKHHHPVLNTSIEYLRIIEVQARLFEKCILGEVDEYTPFVVTK